MCKIEIKNDLYNVVKRIKQIDKSYFVVLNIKQNKYEIHNASQPFNTYALTLPYKTLDKRAVDYVLKTRRENVDRIVKEMDDSNSKLQQKIDDEITYKAKYDLTEKIKFLNKV